MTDSTKSGFYEETTPGKDQTFLDANELAEGHDYFELGYVERSPDETLMAYAVDTNGSERHELRFRELATGRQLEDVLREVYYGFAWAADSHTVLYVRPDAAMRPYQVWRHRLGTAVADDVLVMQEDDERFEVSVEPSKSERFIFITTSSQVSAETYFLRSDAPDAEAVLVEPRRPEIEYTVDHQEDRFLILTNDGATNFRLMVAPISSPGRGSWTELVAERPGVRLNFTDAHQDHRELHGLTSNAFRDHLILEYEIPKYDGDLGAPNVFVHLDDEVCRRKVEALRSCFPSQAGKPWFDDDVFRALLRLRGMESRSPSGLAEAFYGRKLVL